MDLLIIAILAIVLGGAGFYVYRSRKSGRKCIGCPSGGSCSSCSCGCGK
jgi:predicted nucleic acid-binding Zn ribbon protein